MTYTIEKAAVIGSGVMGSAIAALLANVGIPVYLYDLVPNQLTEEEKRKGLSLASPEVRYRIVAQNRLKLLKLKPAPLYTQDRLELITPCNLEDDLEKLAQVDWIVEAIVENLEAKRALLAKIEACRGKTTIVSSNTSGISLKKMVAGRSASFARHFLGTHFFNPPRYLKLVELIPTSHTLPEVTSFMHDFLEKVLGKGVVLARDTPNFIANRIGVYGLMVTLEAMQQGGYTIGEVDSVTGPALGRPKSATFGTLDMVGLDTFLHVAEHMYEQVEEEKEKAAFIIPGFLKEMVERNWLGQKTGQGFYKRIKGARGTDTLELDLNTWEYRPVQGLKSASLERSKGTPDLAKTLPSLIYAEDRAGRLAWQVTKRVLLYSASRLEEIADDLVSIDRAMKWGFGWELGPFEIWDLIGVERSLARMKAEGEPIPSWVEEMLAQGKDSFYQQKAGKRLYFSMGVYHKLETRSEEIDLASLKEEGKVIKGNSGASLIDLGDGVACLEFHSPKQAIGADILKMIQESIREVEKNYLGLVIGHQGKHFCVGANLLFILLAAQEGNWLEIDLMVRTFQQSMQAIRYSKKPVVAAPFGLTLGGGTELCLVAAGLQAASESYMGLVEVGVGLIPGGGGNKELLMRLSEALPQEVKLDEQQLVNFAFETIAQAKVSTGAEDARKYYFLRPQDRVSINQSFQLYEAKQQVLALAKAGYRPPRPRRLKVVGSPGKALLELGIYHLKLSGKISEHDYKIGSKLAHVLCGGDLPAGTEVDEQYLLDLEREAFVSLAGEPLSQARMIHMLRTGKPLRN